MFKLQITHTGFAPTTSKAALSPQSQYPPLFQVREAGLQLQAVAFFRPLVNVSRVPHLKHASAPYTVIVTLLAAQGVYSWRFLPTISSLWLKDRVAKSRNANKIAWLFIAINL
jgi:hypothetical protein